MAYAMTKQGSLDNCITYEFICDTVEDMNAIEDRYRTIGSIAIVLQGTSGLEVYISGSDKQWNSLSSIGGSAADSAAGLSIHICGQNEVSNGLPNISEPDETSIYLVPAADASSGDLYDEYVYVGDNWEKFGGGGSNIDLSSYAPKASPVFTGSISLGRASGSTVGEGSIAEGHNVVASGDYSHAEGYGELYDPKTIAGNTYTTGGAYGDYSHAEGYGTLALGSETHAEGTLTLAHGDNSHAEGWGTSAYGTCSHAEGEETTAEGNFSHVEGIGTYTLHRSQHVMGEYNVLDSSSNSYIEHGNYVEIVGNGTADDARSNARTLDWDGNEYLMGDLYVGCASDSSGGNKVATINQIPNMDLYAPKASPEFTGSISMWRLANSTVGLNSMTVGYGNTASANEAIATGYYTVASGTDSTAIGYYTTASAQRAFASGDSTTASNNNAHAEGYHTTASGSESHAEGSNTTASSYSSHAEGEHTIASGYHSHAEGYYTLAQGSDSHAEGQGGKLYINDQQVDAGAIGSQSHSEGSLTRALGSYSHAEGGYTVASDSGAHAEGYQATASGYASHAEGVNAQATYYASHAEGYYTVASNSQAHAEGANTTASGYCAHAEGYNTTASNSYTHAEGAYTIAAGTHQHVSGKYNVEDTFQGYEEWEANKSYEVGDIVKVTTIYNNKTYREIYECKTANSDSTFISSHWNYESGSSYAEIIGNGTADDARSNARALDWDGNEYLKGNIYVGCNADSTSGAKVATEAYVNARIPAPPTTDGTYTLEITVSNGEATYSWI